MDSVEATGRNEKSSENQGNNYLSGYLAAWFKIIATGMITLVAFEAIAVNTAMPFIVDRLDGKNLFALAAGISMSTQLITTALAGTWVDTRGPKPVIYVGIAAFTGGLLVASFAPNIWFVVVGRAVQGLGGGLLIVPLYVMVGSYVLPHKQPAFFAWSDRWWRGSWWTMCIGVLFSGFAPSCSWCFSRCCGQNSANFPSYTTRFRFAPRLDCCGVLSLAAF